MQNQVNGCTYFTMGLLRGLNEVQYEMSSGTIHSRFQRKPSSSCPKRQLRVTPRAQYVSRSMLLLQLVR